MSENILYVGHSLIAGLVNEMSEHTTGWVKEQNIPGSPLIYNWDHAYDLPDENNARLILSQGDTDILILTEAIPLASHVQWNDSSGYAKRFYDLAIQSNPDTKVYLYETWHDLRSGTGVDVPYDDGDAVPWRTRIDQSLPMWEDIVADVNATRPAGAPEMQLIPVGQAMGKLYDAIAAGQIPGVDDIRDFFIDDIHYNEAGREFVAMVQYATIHGEAPDFGPEVLQDIAWDAVSDYFDLDGFTGTPGNDVIHGLDGNDIISGLAGDDKLFGGKGHDTVFGGEGSDKLNGEKGDDLLDGGQGSDLYVFKGKWGDDSIVGYDPDNDRIEINLPDGTVHKIDSREDLIALGGQDGVIEFGNHSITLVDFEI